MRLLLALLLFLISFSQTYSQHKFKTTRDTTKYSESDIDIKVFRAFNNIKGGFVHTLIDITNKSLMPVSFVAPAGLYTFARINKNHYDESSAALLGLSEVTNEAVTIFLKHIFQRSRPYRILNNVNFTDTNSVKGSHSLPSGHASGSFVIATSLTLRYPDKPVLIAGLFTYATVVSLGRIYWGVHYPSDALLGMLVGAGSAVLIYSLRKPIIKAKNNLFNQSKRTDNFKGDINTPVFLLSLAATDIINYYFTKSNNKVLKSSNINFSTSGKVNYLNYNYSF